MAFSRYLPLNMSSTDSFDIYFIYLIEQSHFLRAVHEELKLQSLLNWRPLKILQWTMCSQIQLYFALLIKRIDFISLQGLLIDLLLWCQIYVVASCK